MNASFRLCFLLSSLWLCVVAAHAQSTVAPDSPRLVDPRQPTPRHAYSPFDAAAPTPARPVDFNPARILIKLKPEALNVRVAKSLTGSAAPLAALTAPGLGTLSRVFPAAQAPVASIPTKKSTASSATAATPEPTPPDLRLWMQADVTPGTDVSELIETLKQNSAVATAEPDILFRLSDEGVLTPLAASAPTLAATALPASSAIPDGSQDPLMASQWHLATAKVKQAWAHLQSQGLPAGGNRDIIIAVIDSGVDYTHPDLAANMWTNSREIPGNGIDDDGNGLIDDVHGASFIGSSFDHKGNPMDDNGHGTHVAGIIAAAAGNGIGGVGIAYNTQIMAIKAAQYSGVLSSSDISEAIYYAVEKGADVINMSFGGPAQSLLVEDALAVAFGQAVLVASAGNSGKHSEAPPAPPAPVPNYPAAYIYVLGTMAQAQAANAKGEWLAGFSNWDSIPNSRIEYELMAPGVEIPSTLPGGQYAAWSGTSMAAPVVSGLAALVRTKFPNKDVYSSRFIMGQIASTGARLTGVVPGGKAPADFAAQISYYSADALKAVSTTPEPELKFLDYWIFDGSTINAVNDGDGIVDAGETIELAVVIKNRWGKADPTTVKLSAQAEGAVGPSPYITWLNDTVDYGAVGNFGEDDNGIIFDANGAITGVRFPFKFTVSADCPNDFVIPILVTMTCGNGFDANDPKAPYTFTSRFNCVVQKGRTLPTSIDADMTLGPDTYWIIDRPVVVRSAATLRVLPGTQIQFYSADPKEPYTVTPLPVLLVEGKLLLEGTASEPVDLFPSALRPDWPVSIVQAYAPMEGGGAQAILRYARVLNPCIGRDISGIAGGGAVDELSHSYLSVANKIMTETRYGSPTTTTVSARLSHHNRFYGMGASPYGQALIPHLQSPDTSFAFSPPEGNTSLFDSCRLAGSVSGFAASQTGFSNSVFLVNHARYLSRWDGEIVLGATLRTGGTYDVEKTLAPAPDVLSYGGHSYAFFNSVADVSLLRSLIATKGGYLVCFNTEAEGHAVGSYFVEKWRTLSGGSSFFVGYNDRDGDGTFTWEDGGSSGVFFSGDPGRTSPYGEKEKMRGAHVYLGINNGVYDNNFNTYYYYAGDTSDPVVVEFPSVVTSADIDAERRRLLKESGLMRNCAILNQWWRPDGMQYWLNFVGGIGANMTTSLVGNYWGGASTALLEKAVWDQKEVFSFNTIAYEPVLSTPPADCWPFVVDCMLTNSSGTRLTKVGAEAVTFTVTFNRDMSTAKAPRVSFGPDTPLTDYTLHPVGGGWQNPRTWVGTFNVSPVTGDGYQLIKITDAVAADDPWLVNGNDEGRFRFEIVTSGVESLTLQASGGDGRVNLSWTQTDFELLAGYNLYRSTSETGTYTRINSTIIPAQTKQFTDVNVQPGQPYYYKFTVVQTDMSESSPSNIAQATPRDTILPVIAHTPLTQAEPNLSLSFAADITDNVAVTGATLFYRTQGQTTYQSRAMVKVSGNRWTVALEGSLVVSPGVEYYLSATDGVSTALSGRPEQPYLIVVQDKPVITSVSPAQGGIAGGTVVTISGSNFKTGTKVYFGSVLATDIVVVSSSQITCKVPVSIPARVSVRVEGANGAFTTLVNAFTFVDTNPTLYLPDKTTFSGAILTVPLDIANASGLVSADVTVTYAPAILRIRTATLGALASGWTLVSNTATSGQVRLSMAAGGAAVTGSGTLANLEFDVIGSPSQTGALTISAARLNDDAITATVVNGSVLINVGYAMSGRVYYWSDSSRNVAGTTLTLEGSGTQTATAAANGTYTLANLQNVAYGLTPSKTTQVESISAYDAALVLQHAAGLTTLTGNAAKAADVNLNGEVTAMDAYHILRQASAAESITVPGAGKAWLFTPATRTYAALAASQTGQDFTAVLLGDVSGNWQSTTGQSGATVKTGLATVTDTTGNRTMVYLMLQTGTVPVYGVDVVLTYGAGQTLTAAETEPGISNSINSAGVGTIRAALAKAEGLTGDYILLAATFSGTSDPQVAVQSITMNEGAVLPVGAVDPLAFDHDGDGKVDPLGVPLIKTQPQGQSVVQGAPVTFTVVAAGNPSLSYQWLKNTTPISGATSASLSLIGAQTADSGTYTATVSNAAGSKTSDGAVLLVVPANVAPVLAAIPAKTVNESVALTFTASATDADLPAQTLTYSLVGAPAGATINAATGVFAWTPTKVQGPGSFTFTVRVSDGTATADQSVTVTVTGTAQTLTFAALPARVVGANFTLAATASSGLPVSFAVVSGPATLGADGKTVTVGSTAGTVTIRATQAGGVRTSVTYAPATPVEQSFAVTTVAPKAQTIRFTAPAAKLANAAPFDLVATATSKLPVAFAVVSGPATLGANGKTLSVTGPGTVVLKATQPGNATYLPATAVQVSFKVTAVTQTITFRAPTASQLAADSIPLTASASSGLPVTFQIVSGAATLGADGRSLTLTGGGSIVVKATQPGNLVYQAAPAVQVTIKIVQAAQTITFNPPLNLMLDGSPVLLAATSNSGLPVTLSVVSGPARLGADNRTLELTGSGVVTISATQAGSIRVKAATAVTKKITVNTAPASLSVGNGFALFSIVDGDREANGFRVTSATLLQDVNEGIVDRFGVTTTHPKITYAYKRLTATTAQWVITDNYGEVSTDADGRERRETGTATITVKVTFTGLNVNGDTDGTVTLTGTSKGTLSEYSVSAGKPVSRAVTGKINATGTCVFVKDATDLVDYIDAYYATP